uniref:Ribonuclease 4 n=1 Tax=Canis lupus familiaris TaxID=9615 RepID=A0A8C0S9L2_CANLF
MHFCSSTKRILSHSRKEKQELTNNAQVRFAANFLAPECPAARSRAPRSQAVPLGLVPPAAPPAPRSAARPARPAAPTPEAGPGGRAPGEEQGAALHAPPHPGPSCTRTPATPPSAQSKISGEVFASLAAPSITRGGYAAGEKFPPSCASLQPCAPGPGISELVMAPPRTRALLLLLLLTLLGLGLVQPADGQDRMYQRFLRQHVDPEGKGGNDTYCNVMMQRRKMTTRQCKRFNTFVHEDIWNIRSICSTTNIQCKNGKMNCHEGVVKVTDCRETGSSRAPNCRYRASASTRHVVIACEGDPELPVHFDR